MASEGYITVDFKIKKVSGVVIDLTLLSVGIEEPASSLKKRLEPLLGISRKEFDLVCRDLVLKDNFSLKGLPNNVVVYAQHRGVAPSSSAPTIVNAKNIPGLLQTSPAVLGHNHPSLMSAPGGSRRRPLPTPSMPSIPAGSSPQLLSGRRKSSLSSKGHRRSRTKGEEKPSSTTRKTALNIPSPVKESSPSRNIISANSPLYNTLTRTHADNSNVTLADPQKSKLEGLSGSLNVGETITLKLVTCTAAGGQLLTGGSRVSLVFTGPEDTEAKIVDKFDGTYLCSLLVKKRGMYEGHAHVNGQPIAGSPFPVFFKASRNSDASKSTATGVGLTGPTVGRSTMFFVETKDAYGNPSHSQDDALTVAVRSGGENIQARVMPDGSGTYTVSYIPTVEGAYEISVQLGVQHIQGSPFKTRTASAVSTLHTVVTGDALENGVQGYANTFNIETRNKGGQKLMRGGETFNVDISGVGRTRCLVNDNRDGTYSVSYQCSLAGTYVLVILHRGKHLSGSPFTVNVATSPQPDSSSTIPEEVESPEPELAAKAARSWMNDTPETAPVTTTAPVPVSRNRASSVNRRRGRRSSAVPNRFDLNAKAIATSTSPASPAPIRSALLPPQVPSRNSSKGPQVPSRGSSRNASLGGSGTVVPPVPIRRRGASSLGLPSGPPLTAPPPIPMSPRNILRKHPSSYFATATPSLKLTEAEIAKVRNIQKHIRCYNACSALKNLRMVNLACGEILTTEKKYLENLEMIKTEYRDPLQTIALNSKSIGDGKLSVIFSNLEFIISVSSDLIGQLSPNFGNGLPDVAGIASVFAMMAPTLRYTYTRYINNYDQSLKTLRWAREHSPELSAFLENKAQTQALTLGAFLIMPVQRLPKYELLLRECLRYTPHNVDGHDMLVEAMTVVNEVVMFINERKRSVENLSKIVEVLDTVAGLPEGLFSLDVSRYFIGDASIKCHSLKKGGKSGKDKVKHFILFSDLLLVCKKEAKKQKLYRHENTVKISDMYLQSLPEPVMKLILPNTMYHLTFDTIIERDGWLRHFEKCGVTPSS